MTEINDAAVEAAAVRLHRGDPRRPYCHWRGLSDWQRDTYRMLAYDALTAALPHLTATPSATREEVRDEIAGHPIGSGYYATSVGGDEAGEIADALLACFNITPKETDR